MNIQDVLEAARLAKRLLAIKGIRKFTKIVTENGLDASENTICKVHSMLQKELSEGDLEYLTSLDVLTLLATLEVYQTELEKRLAYYGVSTEETPAIEIPNYVGTSITPVKRMKV